ncbi:MAG: sigma-70 family RNA polymerase sigma factor [Saprospiraceae bacterium]|nr:sigma-70 family RNA polymerase sigma factor [Saprospiraceae bacterium]
MEKPIEKVYNKFPSIKTNCDLNTVKEFTTNVVFTNLPNIGQNKLVQYAGTVARNFCLDIKRQLAKAKPAIEHYYTNIQSNNETAEPSFLDTLLNRVGKDDCVKALKSECSQEEFIVLYMHFFQEKRFVQIAKELHMNENTVKSHKKRGLEKLHHYFTQNS